MASGTIQQPASYIVEKGTSGIWTYRKWSDGIAECWCSTNGNVISGWSTDGITLTLPFTFATVDYGIVQFHNYQIAKTYTVLTKTNATTINIQTNADYAFTGFFSIDVKGTWK